MPGRVRHLPQQYSGDHGHRVEEDVEHQRHLEHAPCVDVANHACDPANTRLRRAVKLHRTAQRPRFSTGPILLRRRSWPGRPDNVRCRCREFAGKRCRRDSAVGRDSRGSPSAPCRHQLGRTQLRRNLSGAAPTRSGSTGTTSTPAVSSTMSASVSANVAADTNGRRLVGVRVDIGSASRVTMGDNSPGAPVSTVSRYRA